MLTLLYHNILKAPENELPVAEGQVTVDTFRRHVYHFRKSLLHPLEVHEQLMKGKTPRGILVTFDDGGRGIEDAGQILAELGAAGVAFICPGAVHKGLWFYKLADVLVRATAPRLRWSNFDLPLNGAVEQRAAYSTLSKDLFDLPAAQRDDCLEEITKALNVPAGKPDPALTVLDKPDLLRLAQTGGMVFANHTWSHPNLIKLSATELMQEVNTAEDWLQSSGLPVLPWFAFPRGVYDKRVREAATKICPITFGASASEPDDKVLPRTYLWQGDANWIRFLAKTAWEGRLRQHLLRR